MNYKNIKKRLNEYYETATPEQVVKEIEQLGVEFVKKPDPMEKFLYYFRAIILLFTLSVLIAMFKPLLFYTNEQFQEDIFEMAKLLGVCGVLNLITVIVEELFKIKKCL